jgi:ATP-binding cassette subfamily B (MDR/TAP) protein 1
MKIAIKKGNIAGLLYGLSQMILSCILALIFFIGSLFIQHFDIEVLKIFTAIYAIMFAAIQAGGNLQFIPNIIQLKVAAVNIFKVLDQEDEEQMERQNSARLEITNAKGNIDIKDIGFKYENRDDFVFRKLSLKITEGQKVAFVGSSGCGKSTILQLLLRMYPLTEGEITLDGHKIEDYRLGQLRSQFGVVSQ